MAFSPRGRTLASGGYDGTIQLWDVSDPAHPKSLGLAAASYSIGQVVVAFSANGHTLASGGFDGMVRLWDVSDPAHPKSLSQPLTGSNAPVVSVAFSPDRHTLASGDSNGTTRLWNLDVKYAIERICSTAGGLTPRQWNEYIPQLRYRPSCTR